MLKGMLVIFLGVIMKIHASENLIPDTQESIKPLEHLYDVLTSKERDLPMFDRIISFLNRQDAEFRVIKHEPEGQSDKIAKIRGNEPKQGAKALLTMSKPSQGEPTYHLVVLPGNEELDFGKLKKLVGIKNTSLASLQAVEELIGCVRGAIPPFSFSPRIKLIVDESLVKNNKEIVFNAGRLDRSIFLNVKDYLRVVLPYLSKIVK